MSLGSDDPMTTTNDLMACAHCALFYRRQDEYAREVCSFVRDGMSAAEPVLVAVPGRRLDLVRGALGETGEAVSFADMAVLGRNPARIIPAFTRAGSPPASCRSSTTKGTPARWSRCAVPSPGVDSGVPGRRDSRHVTGRQAPARRAGEYGE